MVHSGLLEHQGVAISSGRRLILVGFLRDQRFPLTRKKVCRFDEVEVGDVVRLKGEDVRVEAVERKTTTPPKKRRGKRQGKHQGGTVIIRLQGRRVRDDKKVASPYKPPMTEIKYMSAQYATT